MLLPGGFNMASTREDFDITKDEVERLAKAFKDDEFRKLFQEYAEEISDPENRRKYEEEIKQMEMDRGMDVKFIHPKPCYVLKTSVNGDKKAFINICSNDYVGKPSTKPSVRENDEGKTKRGMDWSIPYSLTPPRDDLDKARNRCVVYDCVFHPDTTRMADTNQRFRNMINDTALDGIERQFQVKLDRNNIKMPKMNYKGTPTPSIVRSAKPDGPTGVQDGFDALNIPYPYSEEELQAGEEKSNKTAKSATKISGNRQTERADDNKNTGKATVPKHTIVHRGHFDMQNFRNAPDAMPTTRPQELVVSIHLPLLTSAKTINLDIYEQNLTMECAQPAAYKLDLKLPYKVNESQGGAKFDKSKRCLIVTLPVLLPKIPNLPSFAPKEEKQLVQEVVPDDKDDGKENSSDGAEDKEEVKRENGVTEPSKEQEPRETEETTSQSKDSKVIRNEEDKDANDDQDDTARDSSPATATSEEVQRSEDKLPEESDVSTKTMMEKIDYQLPDFSYKQDTQTVVFYIDVPNVEAESIKKELAAGLSGVHVTMETRGEDGEESQHYSLCVQFPPNYGISPDVVCEVVSERVILLLKKTTFKGTWNSLKIGKDADTLEERSFLTAEGLESTINSIVERTLDDSSKPHQSVSLEVTAATDEKFVFELQPSTGGGDSKAIITASASSGKDATEDHTETLASKMRDLDVDSASDMATAEASSSGGSDSSSSADRPVDMETSSRNTSRSGRHKITKSVSFNETVVVENFKERSKKAQKKKPGKVEVSFRTKERLKESSDDDSESPCSPRSPFGFEGEKGNKAGNKKKGFFKNGSVDQKGSGTGKSNKEQSKSDKPSNAEDPVWKSRSTSNSEPQKSAIDFANTLMYDLD